MHFTGASCGVRLFTRLHDSLLCTINSLLNAVYSVKCVLFANENKTTETASRVALLRCEPRNGKQPNVAHGACCLCARFEAQRFARYRSHRWCSEGGAKRHRGCIQVNERSWLCGETAVHDQHSTAALTLAVAGDAVIEVISHVELTQYLQLKCNLHVVWSELEI